MQKFENTNYPVTNSTCMPYGVLWTRRLFLFDLFHSILLGFLVNLQSLLLDEYGVGQLGAGPGFLKM